MVIKNINFFNKSATDLARDLLGKIVCHQMDDGFIMRCRITETEAYSGDEPFCYGYGGKNPQNKNEVFYSVGKVCAYADMLMISCLDEMHPNNVLIRSLDCYKGPKNCSEALDIRTEVNGIDLTAVDVIWLEDDGAKIEYITAKRVNIPDDKQWNFTIKTITF